MTALLSEFGHDLCLQAYLASRYLLALWTVPMYDQERKLALSSQSFFSLWGLSSNQQMLVSGINQSV